MSENDVTTTSHHTTWWLLLPAALAVVAVAFGFVVSRERPVPVTIDGARIVLAEGTTVEDLESAHAFAARPGRLLSVTGSVVDTDGGEPIRVLVNGHRADHERYVFRRDVLESRDGSDAVEATVTIREPIPIEMRITGHGPVMRLVNPGSVGVRMQVIGEHSKETVSEKVVVPAQDMVVVRTRPQPHEKLVALTFDDGPWPGQTDKILDILEHEGVRATFFMVGVRVNRAPELAKRVVKSGSLAGNHTLGHRLLTKSKPKEIKRQITDGADSIYRATGILPTWFRPPYGAIDDKVWKQVRLSREHVALWDVDTRDWSRPGVKKIVRAATKNARSGAIILMHDGGVNRTQTIKALPKIIRNLKKRGYVFVTIQELASAK